MIVLNFSHALTAFQENQIKQLISVDNSEWENRKTIRVDCFLDINSPFERQVESIINSIPLDETEWTSRLLVIPPPISHSAILIILAIFVKCGYLPEIVRIKKKPKITPPQYVVAETIQLQSFKDRMRSSRNKQKIVVKEYRRTKNG